MSRDLELQHTHYVLVGCDNTHITTRQGDQHVQGGPGGLSQQRIGVSHGHVLSIQVVGWVVGHPEDGIPKALQGIRKAGVGRGVHGLVEGQHHGSSIGLNVALQGVLLIQVDDGRSVGSLGKEGSRREANNDQSHDPSSSDLGQQLPVHTLGHTLQHAHASGGANLAMGGGKRNSKLGSNHNHNGSTKLNGKATGRSNAAHLDTNGTHDLVSVGSQANHNAESSQAQNPDGDSRLGLDASVVVDGPDGSERTNGVGNIVGTMGESIANGSEDLQVLEALLSHGVKLLRELVNVMHITLLVEDIVHIVVHAGHHGIRELLPASGLVLHGLHVLHKGLISGLSSSLSSSLGLECGVDLLPQEGDNTHSNDESSNSANDERDPDGSGQLELDLGLRTLEDDEERVHDHGQEHQDGEHPPGALVAVVGAEHGDTDASEQEHGEDARQHRGKDPGQDDGSDTLHEGEAARLLVPGHRTPAAAAHGHADDAADGRVGGRHGQLVVGGENEPNAGSQQDAKHAVHVELGRVEELLIVGNSLTHSFGDIGTEEDGATELEDGGDHQGLLDGDGLGADRGPEGIGNIVSADAVSDEKRQKRAADDNPLVLIPHFDY